MISQHHRRSKRASGLIALLALQSQTNGLSQISPKSDGTIAQTAQNGNQKPSTSWSYFVFFCGWPVHPNNSHNAEPDRDQAYELRLGKMKNL